MEDDPSLQRCVKILLMGILLLVAVVSVCIIFNDSDASAASTISGQFKPSVGKSGYAYKWYSMTWVNYCPGCHRYGTLMLNPKGVPEHEITCWKTVNGKRGCGADFCGVTGRDKSYTCRWKLTPATGAKPMLVNCSQLMQGKPIVKTNYYYKNGLKYKVVRKYSTYSNGKIKKLTSKKVYYWSKRLRYWKRA